MKLLRLYPSWWRDRYRDEMQAVLDEHHVTIRTVIDLLGGAIDAWISGRRSFMAASRQSPRLPVWMLAIPSMFAVAIFVTQIYLHLLDWLGFLIFAQGATWSAICFATGVRVFRIGGTATQAARYGLATGLIAWALSWVVNQALGWIGVAAGGLSPANFAGGDAGTFARELIWVLLPIIGFRALASAIFGPALAVLGFWLAKLASQVSIVVTRDQLTIKRSRPVL